MLPESCTEQMMKTFFYILGLLIAFIGGFIFCWCLRSFSITGAQLPEDAVIYNIDQPIASLKRGTILLKNKYTAQYMFSFYLDKIKADIIDPKDTYYSDKASGAGHSNQQPPKD